MKSGEGGGDSAWNGLCSMEGSMLPRSTLMTATAALILSHAGPTQARTKSRAVIADVASVPYQPPPPPVAEAPSRTPWICQASPPEPPSSHWYGYQIMLADAASIGLGFATERAEVLLAGYLVAPIITHAVHRRVELAVISPVARLMLPLLGMTIGSHFGGCNAGGDECGMGGMIYGTGIGVAAAVLLDWSLAWSRTPSPSPPPSTARSSGLAVTAGFAPTSKGASLVLGGQF
jgi:hypothetical protein